MDFYFASSRALSYGTNVKVNIFQLGVYLTPNETRNSFCKHQAPRRDIQILVQAALAEDGPEPELGDGRE